jgi:hypothetical protein
MKSRMIIGKKSRNNRMDSGGGFWGGEQALGWPG